LVRDVAVNRAQVGFVDSSGERLLRARWRETQGR